MVGARVGILLDNCNNFSKLNSLSGTGSKSHNCELCIAAVSTNPAENKDTEIDNSESLWGACV